MLLLMKSKWKLWSRKVPPQSRVASTEIKCTAQREGEREEGSVYSTSMKNESGRREQSLQPREVYVIEVDTHQPAAPSASTIFPNAHGTTDPAGLAPQAQRASLANPTQAQFSLVFALPSAGDCCCCVHQSTVGSLVAAEEKQKQRPTRGKSDG